MCCQSQIKKKQNKLICYLHVYWKYCPMFGTIIQQLKGFNLKGTIVKKNKLY